MTIAAAESTITDHEAAEADRASATRDRGMATERWPALPYDAWKDTYATLHMWSQIVGKIALARIAPLNHSWGIALDVTARGLTTRTLPHGDRSFRVAFDFIDHQLVIETSDGNRRTLALAPRTRSEEHTSEL